MSNTDEQRRLKVAYGLFRDYVARSVTIGQECIGSDSGPPADLMDRLKLSEDDFVRAYSALPSVEQARLRALFEQSDRQVHHEFRQIADAIADAIDVSSYRVTSSGRQ